MEMLNELRKIQRKRKYTDPIMAEKLGITRAWWNFIKNEKFKMSERLKRKAFQAFPEELRDIFLTSNSTPRIVNKSK